MRIATRTASCSAVLLVSLFSVSAFGQPQQELVAPPPGDPPPADAPAPPAEPVPPPVETPPPAEHPVVVPPPTPEPPPPAEEPEPTLEERVTALEGFHWSGYIQGQYEVHDDSENEIDGTTLENADRFLIRRGRLKLQYDGIEHARFMMQIDATTTGVSLRDAVASIFEPWTSFELELAAGVFKNPFGFEVLQSSGDRVFPERSQLGRTLYPGERDLGVRLSGKRDILRFAFALVNGNPIGDRAFPGRDPNSYKDFVGRIGIATSLLDVGVSGHVGTEFQPGSPAVDASTTWRDENRDAAVDPNEVTTTDAEPAVSSENATRMRAGLDVQLHYEIDGFGKLEVLGEIALAHRGETDLADAADLLAGYFGVVQHYGHLAGLAFRVDFLDPNLDEGSDQTIILEPVLLLYPVKAVRVSLAYDIVLEQGEAERNNVLTARMQVKF